MIENEQKGPIDIIVLQCPIIFCAKIEKNESMVHKHGLEGTLLMSDSIHKVWLTSQPPFCFICKVKNSKHLGFNPRI